MDSFHGQCVAEHEGDAFGCADIGQPVPREHALGRHGQISAIWPDDLKEGGWRRRDVAVHEHLAGAVENTDVHGLYVQIDPAVVRVLSVVESHRSSSCASAH